jgi:hypothetical protein
MYKSYPINRIYTLFSSLSIAVRFIATDKMALVRILCEASLCSVYYYERRPSTPQLLGLLSLRFMSSSCLV